MSAQNRFSDEFKKDAVSQVVDRGYPTREDARRDVFEYIELFYNPKRKHTNNGMLSPVDFEIRQQKLNKAGV